MWFARKMTMLVPRVCMTNIFYIILTNSRVCVLPESNSAPKF